MEKTTVIFSSLGVITLLLVIAVVVKRDKELLKEIISLWLGVVGLSVLAFFYTLLTV